MAIEKMNSDNSRFGSVRYFYSDRFFVMTDTTSLFKEKSKQENW